MKKTSHIQQLIQCLSAAVSALWSNRIFSFLTFWCERPSKNSLSRWEEKREIFFSPGRALSETFLMHRVGKEIIWCVLYLMVGADRGHRLPGSSRPPYARGALRQTRTGWVPLGSTSIMCVHTEKRTRIAMGVKWCQLCAAGETHRLALFAVAEEINQFAHQWICHKNDTLLPEQLFVHMASASW